MYLRLLTFTSLFLIACGGAAPLPIGAMCATDADCEAGATCGMSLSDRCERPCETPKICTHRCSSDAECGDGAKCAVNPFYGVPYYCASR